MRGIRLLLVAVAVAACSPGPVTVDVPPTVHRGTAPGYAGGPIGLAAMANTGICYMLRDDTPHQNARTPTEPGDHHVRATVARPGWGERRPLPPITFHTCDS